MTRILARMLMLSMLALTLMGCVRFLDSSPLQPTPIGGGNGQVTPVPPVTTLPPAITPSLAAETQTPGVLPTTAVAILASPTVNDTAIPLITVSPTVTPLPVLASLTPSELPQVVTVVVTSPPVTVIVTQIITTTPLPTVAVLPGTSQPIIVTSPPIVVTQIITTTPEPTQPPIVVTQIITTTPEPPIVITTTPEPSQPPIVITQIVTAEPGSESTQPTEITQVPLPTMPEGPTPSATLNTTPPSPSQFPPKIDGARGDIIDNQCHYKAVKYDRMIRIAQRFSITLQQLLAANRSIANPNIIYPDQIIQIPNCMGAG